MRQIEVDGYKRINKTIAKKIYDNGNTIYIAPCNARLNGILGYPIAINKDNSDNEDFNIVVNAFIYYNCVNELGRYPSYYVKK
jgi:hypothetical protein